MAQVFGFGKFENPDFFSEEPLNLDQAFMESIEVNYNDNVIGSRLQVPFGSHDRDLRVSAGTVQRVFIDTTNKNESYRGFYAVMRISDEQARTRIDNGDVNAVSPRWTMDYVSSKIDAQGNQRHYGPTLMHVAIVDVPHFEQMSSLEKAEANKILDNNKPAMLAFKQKLKTKTNAGAKMDPKLIEQIDALSDEDLKELKLSRNSDGGNEGDGNPEPEDKPEGTKDKKDEPVKNDAEPVVAGKEDSRIAEAMAQTLEANCKLAQSELTATLKDNIAKVYPAQRERIQNAIADLAKIETASELNAARRVLDERLADLCAGADRVELGQRGSVKEASAEVKKSIEDESAAMAGVTPERAQELNVKHKIDESIEREDA